MDTKTDVKTITQETEQVIALLQQHLNVDAAQKTIADLTAKTEDPTLWDNPDEARKILQEKSALETQLADITTLQKGLSDAQTLLELAEEMDDTASRKEAKTLFQNLNKKAQSARVATLFSGPADKNNAYIDIHPGAGGTESQDWASMMLRMYLRWAERRGFKTTMVEEQAGEEAGIKSATVHIAGHNAYGLIKTEIGVHRLVRCSPFDSQNRRHTSFASLFAYPEVDDTIDIDINPADLRVDTYRASGAGGQHVNTTDSAIRITHTPTNIVVTCQQDRSQHRNRDIAMTMLKAKLYEHELRKQEAERNAQEADKTDIGWGHQIRSYVLHPYQLVKDLRTQHETGNTTAILDGDLDAFIEAALAHKIGV